MTASVLTSEFAELILRDSDGELDAAGADKLLEWLSASERHVRAYVEFAQLQAGLEWGRNAAADGMPLPSVAAPHQETAPARVRAPSPPFSRLQSLAAILLVAVAYYGAGLVLFWGIGTPRTSESRQHAAEFAAAPDNANRLPGNDLARGESPAVCLEEHNCIWQNELPAALHRGSRLRLLSGTAVLEFADGARVALHGPAALEVVTAGSGRLGRGKLTAMVPPRAHGFTIDTPSLRVIDLGTEFGVTVADDGTSAVHVFTGRVDTRTVEGGELGERVPLVAGEAILVGGPAPAGDASAESPQAGVGLLVRRLKADRSLFIEGPAFPASARLLGFYPFDGNTEDASGNGKHAVRVSGIEYVAGHEGQAASFAGRPDSYVDLPLDAGVTAVPDLTWGAWVKPTREITSRSEILSTDNGSYDRVLTIDDRIGGQSTGVFRFAAMAGPRHGVMPLQQVPVPVNEWRFVAAVYRSESKLVALYVEDPALGDGQGGLASQFGTAEIGPSANWIRVGGHFGGIEPFAGAIDNVFIISGALGHPHLEQFRTQGASAVLKSVATEGSAK